MCEAAFSAWAMQLLADADKNISSLSGFHLEEGTSKVVILGRLL